MNGAPPVGGCAAVSASKVCASKVSGSNTPGSNSQAQHFVDVALTNPVNGVLLQRLLSVGLPDCWLVAGCLFQTVWNQRVGRPAAAGIKDYDIFYCDPTDLSWDAEDHAISRVRAAVSDLGIVFDLKNQARVHRWYEQHFGIPCPPLANAQDGIDRFLVAGTCIGLSPVAAPTAATATKPTALLYAPFGLDDCLTGVLRSTLIPSRRSAPKPRAIAPAGRI